MFIVRKLLDNEIDKSLQTEKIVQFSSVRNEDNSIKPHDFKKAVDWIIIGVKEYLCN